MSGFYEKCLVAGLLFSGFFLLIRRIAEQNYLGRWMKSKIEQMDESTRQRLLNERKRLIEGTSKESIWHKTEKILFYSGLKWKYPFLTVEIWMVIHICLFAATGFLGLLILGKRGMFFLPAGTAVVEFVVLKVKMGQANKKVNDNLPKFLDFLGNYSATSGEICAVFQQIAKYMDKPLSDALEECCHEAAFTGDTALALLCMREKIEHPQFKALIHELEINMRYCADYAVLVQSSRRSLRDYMKAAGERGTILREAVINAALLFFMSFVSFVAVDSLIDESIWEILVFTFPGKIALFILGVIFLLFAGKVFQNGG